MVKPMATAIILASVFIGLNNFFSGLIVRPQFVEGTFFQGAFFICPGHYVYDGLLIALYQDNTGVVLTDPDSPFENYLIDIGACPPSLGDDYDEASFAHFSSIGDTMMNSSCNGTSYQFVQYAFGGHLGVRGPGRSAIVLGCILLLARVLTWVALKRIRY